MARDDVASCLLTVVKLAFFLGFLGMMYPFVSSFWPSHAETWPPRDAAEESQIVEGYKRRLSIGDTPVSPLSPETAATLLGRVVDHEVRKADWAEARMYVGQILDRKMLAQAEQEMTPAAKQLLGKIADGRQKRDRLKDLIALYRKRPAATAPPPERAKFDGELGTAITTFGQIPLDAEKCPELATEIVAAYRLELAPARSDPRLRAVVDEIERLGAVH